MWSLVFKAVVMCCPLPPLPGSKSYVTDIAFWGPEFARPALQSQVCYCFNLPRTLSIHQLISLPTEATLVQNQTTCHHAAFGLNGIYQYLLIIIYSVVVPCGLLWSLHNTSSTPLTQGSMSRLGKRSSSSWVSTSGSLITRRAKALSSGKDGKVKMTTMTMMKTSRKSGRWIITVTIMNSVLSQTFPQFLRV